MNRPLDCTVEVTTQKNEHQCSDDQNNWISLPFNNVILTYSTPHIWSISKNRSELSPNSLTRLISRDSLTFNGHNKTKLVLIKPIICVESSKYG